MNASFSIENRIMSKSDLYNKFGISRKTFYKLYLSDMLIYLKMSRQEWKTLHKSTFEIGLSRKIHEYIKKIESEDF